MVSTIVMTIFWGKYWQIGGDWFHQIAPQFRPAVIRHVSWHRMEKLVNFLKSVGLHNSYTLLCITRRVDFQFYPHVDWLIGKQFSNLSWHSSSVQQSLIWGASCLFQNQTQFFSRGKREKKSNLMHHTIFCSTAPHGYKSPWKKFCFQRSNSIEIAM